MERSTHTRPAGSARVRAAGALAVAVAGGWMLALSWGRWPDVQVDFGRELYLAWRLSEGDALQRDVLHFFGPLSAYWNALCFRLLGVGLWTLVACNLALLVGLLFLLHALLRAIASGWAASVALVVFVLVFAFSQYVPVGNYNYLTPYSHELVHGTFLALLGVFLLARHLRRPRCLDLAGSGMALGLVFLTKVEPFVAGAAALCAGLLLSRRSRPGPAQHSTRELGVFVLAAVVPGLLATGLLALALPVGEAFSAVVAPYRWALDPAVSGGRFYQTGMGLEDPGASFGAIGVAVARLALVLVPAAALGWAPRRGRIPAALLAGLLALGLGMRLDTASWLELARALPILVAGLALVACLRLRRTDERCAVALLRIMLLVFALVLLGKLGLHARVYHYGFVLAMPATLLVVVALLDWIPRDLERRGASAAPFRVAVILSLLLFVAAAQLTTVPLYAAKTHPVGAGRDAFLADERGVVVAEMLDAIATRVAPEQTLGVVPEGAMLNYLARRTNPTRLLTCLPFDFDALGAERILLELMTHPPDFLVVTPRDSAEYGPRFFGRDYGRNVTSWIDHRYRPVVQIEGSPLEHPDRRGLLLLARRDG